MSVDQRAKSGRETVALRAGLDQRLKDPTILADGRECVTVESQRRPLATAVTS